jgi:hypothetical protein
MGRSPLSIDVTPKDKKGLANLLSSGVQQVRVVLRALVLLQLANGKSAPLIADTIPLRGVLIAEKEMHNPAGRALARGQTAS